MLRIIFSIIAMLTVTSSPAYSAKEAVLTVESSAFDDGEQMPYKYSLSGPNISPPISWSGVPKNAKSVAIICDDPDTSRGIWTHWVVFNIPPGLSALPENLPDEEILPSGIAQGVNDFGRVGWDGPSPPEGTHRYIFEVYALDAMLDPGHGITRSGLIDAMKGRIIGRGKLVGIYER